MHACPECGINIVELAPGKGVFYEDTKVPELHTEERCKAPEFATSRAAIIGAQEAERQNEPIVWP